MNIVEYEVTATTPEKAFWVLLPYPILVKVGQFILIDSKYDKILTDRYSGSITLIASGTIARLANSWHEVRDTQTLTPLAGFLEENDDGVEEVSENKSMASVAPRRRKRIG